MVFIIRLLWQAGLNLFGVHVHGYVNTAVNTILYPHNQMITTTTLLTNYCQYFCRGRNRNPVLR
jgi:hypothetical protein